MKTNFWKQLKKPFLALAPMADVTDAAFRQMLVRHGKPDVIFTEFVSAAGLCSVGRGELMKAFLFSENERPIVAQVFGNKPKHFYECAKLVRSLGFDGFDINMGCPDRAVVKQGAGSALIANPKLAREIIRAAKDGAGDMPVSVKTRLGYAGKSEIETWVLEILAEKPDALTMHGRTRTQLYNVAADWVEIGKTVDIAKGSGTVIIGNGDVSDREDAFEKARASGVDGVMIGRAFFGKPWLLNPEIVEGSLSLQKRLEMLIEHARLFEKLLSDSKGFHTIKKHFHGYVSGFEGAKELRSALMGSSSAEELEKIAHRAISEMP